MAFFIVIKKLQYNFPKMRGGVKGCLEFFQKKLQFDFPENEGGGSKAVWNFSENSSILVSSPVPKEDNPPFTDILSKKNTQKG